MPTPCLLTRKEYADGNGTDYSYDGANRLATRTWARGIVTTYNYDMATGELTGIDYSDSTPDVSYTYNRLGQPASITDATGTRSFGYADALPVEETLDAHGTAGRAEGGKASAGRPGWRTRARATLTTVGT